MAKLQVTKYEGAGAFDALRDEWRELFNDSDAAPFSSYEWLSTWHAHFGGHLRPCLLVLRDGSGKLLALWPLGVEKTLFGARRLAQLGEKTGGADYLDAIVRKGTERKKAFTALLRYLLQENAFDVLDVGDMALDSPNSLQLAELFGENKKFRAHFTLNYLCPGIALAGDAEKQFQGRERWRNFRRQLKKLQEREGFSWRVAQTLPEARPAFERFLALHEARWAAQGGSDALGSASLAAFHRAVVPKMAQAGLLRLEELWAEGSCRASTYAFEARGQCYFYLSGIEPAWESTSAGLVNLGLSILDAPRRGTHRLDFLRGAEAYKFAWANEMRFTWRVQVATSDRAARACLATAQIAGAVHNLAKTITPGSVLEAFRRYRRARRPSAPPVAAPLAPPASWAVATSE